MYDYVIVGDGKYIGSLIYVCGKSKENAERVLERMLSNPDEEDLRAMKNLTNIRIKKSKSSDCWWNDPFLAN